MEAIKFEMYLFYCIYIRKCPGLPLNTRSSSKTAPFSTIFNLNFHTTTHWSAHLYDTQNVYTGVHPVKLYQASPMIWKKKQPRKDVLYFVLKLFLHCCIHFGKQCCLLYPKIFMQHIFLNYLICTNTSGFIWCSLYK